MMDARSMGRTQLRAHRTVIQPLEQAPIAIVFCPEGLFWPAIQHTAQNLELSGIP
jgi:hypothetical protein